jgi:hypothetical protein
MLMLSMVESCAVSFDASNEQVVPSKVAMEKALEMPRASRDCPHRFGLINPSTTSILPPTTTYYYQPFVFSPLTRPAMSRCSRYERHYHLRPSEDVIAGNPRTPARMHRLLPSLSQSYVTSPHRYDEPWPRLLEARRTRRTALQMHHCGQATSGSVTPAVLCSESA